MGRSPKIKIFGDEYLIKREFIQEGVRGLINFDDKTITISPDLTEEEYSHTLIHEIGHGLISRNSLDQTIGPQLEEVIVDSFATVLTENFDLHKKKIFHKKKHQKSN